MKYLWRLSYMWLRWFPVFAQYYKFFLLRCYLELYLAILVDLLNEAIASGVDFFIF